MPSPDARVLLGEIVGVHGVQGQVRVRTHTADPLDVVAYGPLTAEPGGRTLVLEGVREVKGAVVIARVPGVADRDAAAALKGLRLYVARSALPAPEEEEFYHADLEGLQAELTEGGALGRVRRVVNFGAGDMLEIDREGGSLLVPFTRAIVPVVDLAGGRIVVDPPAGLLSNEPEDKGS
jgi:16S rRNA processing protein RimM